MMQLKIKRVRSSSDLPLPRYETPGASGLDLRADIESGISVAAGERVLVPTGIAMAIPEGFEAQVRPRSGLALKHGISMVNTPGTIDADYRGEISVILINHSKEEFQIQRGDRIAQLVIAPVVQPQIFEVQELEETDRQSGGFGSTGTE